MAVLLDTHAFLWWCEERPGPLQKGTQDDFRRRMPSEHDELMGNRDQAQPGKLKLPSGFEQYIPEQMAANGFSILDLGLRHITRCIALPWRLRDPFDRLLISQAIADEQPVVTRDKVFEQYGVLRVLQSG